MARKLPWRTVIVLPEEGRFTDKELDDAIRTVMNRRARRQRRMKERQSGDGVGSRRSREAGAE